MRNDGPLRGPQPAISKDFWPELQRMERAGQTLSQMVEWLSGKGVNVSVPTVGRTIEKIRAAAPVVKISEPPDMEPANDEDELKVIRKLAREEMDGGDWKQRQGGAALLIRLRAEERATRAEKVPAKPKDEDAADRPWQPPTFGVKPATA